MLIASELYENRDFFLNSLVAIRGVGKAWKTKGEEEGTRDWGLGIRIFLVLVYILDEMMFLTVID